MTTPDVVDREVHLPPAPALDTPIVPAVRKSRSILVYLAYVWLIAVIALAALADVLPLASYSIPIGKPRQGPDFSSFDLWLGTDQQGRSILSRCVYGARVSLLVGTVAGLIGAVIGTLLGMLAGYLGKAVDWIIRLITDAMLAFPPLILLLALSSILTPSVRTLLVGLTLLIIPTFVRLALANTLAWSSREFVTAARNMGAGHTRILVKEILPNLLPPLGAFLPVVMAALIVAEGSLSFLGMGIPPPQPSWGGMISDGKEAIADSPHMVLVPAVVIFFTVFALNQAGDHLRSRFDRTMRD
ncbi:MULTISPECIES: ABC transporter permease [unclassified Parafrankia]|uniref:ABC transporter permease n=1 Tax=unclassified Parafrankia TaxID=2994368 RepID=UPI000DA59DE5|nr:MULTISPECIES: ABC transporter permease [unclassified Parafrankia]TCJ31320.1 ABC transporter permease [Parafrankia sp. BMG5.11]CAI7977746.1 peptide/nickel transport system permease protein [Frankia sp. Hr75.2]SQD96716.1 Binding-protein-dependent transport systems inner membrane component [Parafrankia sp. Ea1.12]